MASVILFHSVMGLRQVERDAAERLRADGHEVHTPDLYEGRTASSIAEGTALMETFGFEALAERALKACSGLPEKTVLAGFSLGAKLACQVWSKRAQTSGVLLLHGLGDFPKWVRSGLPVQAHFAEPDSTISDQQATDWPMTAFRIGLAAEVYTYEGVGHLYTDTASPDYDAAAAGQTWERALAFLKDL
ncbi:dienelactone hydrolase family protein [Methyloferula stellata]|uniref:dienelactone hydrolase family protein n=1 Tax=Methyloferula stellata TaxID=876270 RepID=UPI00039BBF9D|nr:dienelactone hydrolase family protein [Methyloferula stellata]